MVMIREDHRRRTDTRRRLTMIRERHTIHTREIESAATTIEIEIEIEEEIEIEIEIENEIAITIDERRRRVASEIAVDRHAAEIGESALTHSQQLLLTQFQANNYLYL